MTLERKFVDVNGIRTSYFDEGEGPVILLLHGGDPGRGSTGASIWHRNIPELARSFRVIAPDRLGLGMTDNPATVDDYRMSRICAHIEAFVDALQIRRCVVVGQSRGGFVAAHLTKARPELVERLVIINSASFAPKRAAKRKVTLENFKGLPATVESDERWLSVGTGHITEDWLRESTAMLELSKSWEAVEGFRQASEAYYAEMEALKADLLQWYRSGASAIDSLVVWGVGDPAVSLQDGLDCFEVLSAGSGRTRMYVMDGAGHHCFAERPEEFGSVLRLYLALDSSLLEPSK